MLACTVLQSRYLCLETSILNHSCGELVLQTSCLGAGHLACDCERELGRPGERRTPAAPTHRHRPHAHPVCLRRCTATDGEKFDYPEEFACEGAVEDCGVAVAAVEVDLRAFRGFAPDAVVRMRHQNSATPACPASIFFDDLSAACSRQ